MRLKELLQPECVRRPLSATSKKDAIFELIDLLAEHHGLEDPQSLKRAVWDREMTRTTGIGHGVAIPHGRVPNLDRLIMAVGVPVPSLEFNAIDKKPVSIIILIVSATDQTAGHMQALAKISQILMPETCREALAQASSAQAVYDILMAEDAKAGG